MAALQNERFDSERPTHTGSSACLPVGEEQQKVRGACGKPLVDQALESPSRPGSHKDSKAAGPPTQVHLAADVLAPNMGFPTAI